MKNQKDLIDELVENDNESWILVLDACRADMFYKIVDEKFDVVNNGDVNCTPDWFNTMFNDRINGHLFHGGNPISSIDAGASYNEDEHFLKVPSHELYNDTKDYDIFVSGPDEVNQIVKLHINRDSSITERLSALGYKESEDYNDNFNLNVVRYIQPHTPYRLLPLNDIKDYGRKYEKALSQKIESNDMEYLELIDLYLDNLIWAYHGALDLIDYLQGDIIITSDHGECFGYCGEWFHGEDYHDHMVQVPWMVIQ